MRLPVALIAVVPALLALAGCASAPLDATGTLATPASAQGLSTASASAVVGAASSTAAGYSLSQDELAWDCKRLVGLMQVRILNARGDTSDRSTTMASRALQSAVTGVFGGPRAGGGGADTQAQELAMLRAYNARLRDLGCKSYDLEAELQPKDIRQTPVPTVPAPTPAAAPSTAPDKQKTKASARPAGKS